MRSMVIYLSLTLMACAHRPPLDIPAPPDLAPLTVVTDMPMPLDLAPRPGVEERDGAMCFDAESAHTLYVRTRAAEANTLIASQCAAGYRELASAHEALHAQAESITAAYALAADHWRDAEHARSREHFAHRLEIWAYRLLAAVLAAGALR